MKFLRSIALVGLIGLAVMLGPVQQAGATNTTLTSASITKLETPSATTFMVKCPSLAAAGADTAIVVLDVRRALAAYAGSSGVPTWRIITQAMSTGTDTVRVEMWIGPTTAARTQLTKMGLTSTSRLIDKVAIATDVTLYPFGYLKLKIVNKHTVTAKSPLVYVTLPRMFTIHGTQGQ